MTRIVPILPATAAHGIALRVEDSGVCNMAFFTDPDGNSLILHRRYAPAY